VTSEIRDETRRVEEAKRSLLSLSTTLKMPRNSAANKRSRSSSQSQKKKAKSASQTVSRVTVLASKGNHADSRKLERMPHFFKRCISSSGQTAPFRVTVGSSAAGVPQFTVNGVTGANMSIGFALSGVVVNCGGVPAATISMTDVSEFTTLFEEWAIDYVECVYTASTNTVQATSAGAQFPLIGSAIDYDDLVPKTISQLQEYDTYKQFQMIAGQPIKTTIKPRLVQVMYQPGVSVGYGSAAAGTWIDCAYPTVQCYGHKLAIDAFPTGAVSAYWGDIDLAFTFHMKFRETN